MIVYRISINPYFDNMKDFWTPDLIEKWKNTNHYHRTATDVYFISDNDARQFFTKFCYEQNFVDSHNERAVNYMYFEHYVDVNNYFNLFF